MARKKKRAKRVSRPKYELPELFAFGIIVFVIIMLFSTVVIVTSTNP